MRNRRGGLKVCPGRRSPLVGAALGSALGAALGSACPRTGGRGATFKGAGAAGPQRHSHAASCPPRPGPQGRSQRHGDTTRRRRRRRRWRHVTAPWNPAAWVGGAAAGTTSGERRVRREGDDDDLDRKEREWVSRPRGLRAPRSREDSHAAQLNPAGERPGRTYGVTGLMNSRVYASEDPRYTWSGYARPRHSPTRMGSVYAKPGPVHERPALRQCADRRTTAARDDVCVLPNGTPRIESFLSRPGRGAHV